MKANTKKTFQIYLQSVKKYKLLGILAYLGVAGAVIVSLITPIYIKNFIDLISSGQAKAEIIPQAIGIIKIIFCLEVAIWISWRISDFSSIRFQSSVIADLSNRCFEYLHKHSYDYFNNNFGGSLVKKVKWYSSAFENIADRIMWNFLPLVIAVTFITIYLSTLNIWLGAGVLAWVIIFLSINLIFVRFKLKYDIKRSEAETASTGVLADTITNHNNVKLFNGYLPVVRNFARVTDDLRKIRHFTWRLGAFFHSLSGIIWIALEVGLLYFSLVLWNKGVLTAGWFILIQLYMLNLITKVWEFGKHIQKLYESLADAEEMTIIFDTPHEIQDVVRAKELKVNEGRIVFQDVDFNYHSTRSILKKFNLEIVSKESVALVGASGSGKTTMIKLLLRMVDVSAGHIFIDGQNISKMTQESLWENISMVPQDPILFHRSLMENIRYGKADATDEEVFRAAKLARCHDFIVETDFGYETFVGERGIKLSGGERQRIAIARAILRNAKILVLDEATSSLDSNSENLIQEALAELMKDKTVIVVAHRLSTIRKMDRIIVIDEGKIIEEGKHDDLAKKTDGAYAKLWKLQAGGFIAE